MIESVGKPIGFVFIGPGTFQIAHILPENILACDKAERQESKFSSYLFFRENSYRENIWMSSSVNTGLVKWSQMWFVMVEITSILFYNLIKQ